MDTRRRFTVLGFTVLGFTPVGLLTVLCFALCIAQACQSGRDAPDHGLSTSGHGGTGGESFQGVTGGTPCVGSGFCGSDVHDIRFDIPNIYFVLDRSGSMATLDSSGETRFTIVREAAVEMVTSLGSLINIGAALFPHGDIVADPCHVGGEVFSTMPGEYVEGGGEGAVVGAFRKAINLTPEGGTPISATLKKLTPTLTSLNGRTLVMLLTDGGPNCNSAASCNIDECQPNIEGQCPPAENCCDPSYPGGGPHLCVDRAVTVDAIAAIADAGIEVYVIGISGSQFYTGVLDEMAVAGGTAQAGTPKFHQVNDLTGLSQVFADIASENISCELVVSDPPEEPDFTNVYLDCDLLPQDPENGWIWQDTETVLLQGEACAKLKTGAVSQVHIVTGCPTEGPR